MNRKKTKATALPVLNSSRDQQEPTFQAEVKKPKCKHKLCQKTILVRNIPSKMTKTQLRKHFAQFGKLRDVQFVSNFTNKKHLKKAEIQYIDAASAVNALSSPKDKNNSGRCMTLSMSCNRRKGVKKRVSNGKVDDESALPCHFNKLPDELLSHIFSYLEFDERIGVERVCRRWRCINTKVTWLNMRALNLRDKFTVWRNDPLTTKVLDSILKRCGATLREITFDCQDHRLTKGYPLKIAKYCPLLESADLSKTTIKIDAIKILVEKCKNLHTLKLRNCVGLSEKGFSWVLANGKNLKYLDLSFNPKIKGKYFDSVNNNLETLIFDGCYALSPPGFLQLQNSRIRHLNINNCISLDPEDILTVVTSLKSTLTELQIAKPYNLKEDLEVYPNIIKQCENLQSLNLQQNINVDRQVIDLISTTCRQLRHLNISRNRLSDFDIHNLHTLPHLRSLCLNYLRGISDGSLLNLSLPGKLEHVEVRGCRQIGDDGCVGLIKNCPRLKLLDVSHCKFVTDSVVQDALERSDCCKLEIIAGGSGITNFIDNETVFVSSLDLCSTYIGLGLDYDDFDDDDYYSDEEDDYSHDHSDDFYSDDDGDYGDVPDDVENGFDGCAIA